MAKWTDGMPVARGFDWFDQTPVPLQPPATGLPLC